ncbi:MAG: RNA polymerase sigma factor [Candidatus Acidiferrales bacterium]
MAAKGRAGKMPGGEADERLLVEAAQKDPSQFVALYEIHFERVYAFIVRRVRDRDESEDLTSEVFHRALANLPRFEWRGVPFGAWLIRIAANAVADRWKRNEKVRNIPAAGNPAEINVEEDAHRARLFRLVDALPTDQGRVIAMRFAEEKSIREIARELGRSEGAVKQLQFRGLQGLRAQLNQQPESKPGGKHA